MKQAQLVIFDKDDTLTRLQEFHPATPDIASVLHTLTTENVKMIIVSNSVKDGHPMTV